MTTRVLLLPAGGELLDLDTYATEDGVGPTLDITAAIS